MQWKLDGYVRCPGCGSWEDGAGVFGDQSYKTQLIHTHPDACIEGLEDGLRGRCDSCGGTIVVQLTIEPGNCESVHRFLIRDCPYCDTEGERR